MAEFGQKSDEDIKDEMSYLSRCHINGVQFQDWHNKHHWPLGSTRDGQIMPVYRILPIVMYIRKLWKSILRCSMLWG